MKRSIDRILTTHVGSLARPKDLLDVMKTKLNDEPYDREAYAARVRSAVAEAVRRQVESGIDIVTDGEQGEPGFFAYVRERLAGFEPKSPRRGAPRQWAAEVAAFPEYYEQYFSRAMLGAAIAPHTPMVCTGPVSYRGQESMRRDIDNLKAALEGLNPEEAFMPAAAPSGVGTNEYYRTDEEYLQAVGEAMRTEYQAIVDAGFILQIDDPWLTDVYGQDPASSVAERRRTAETRIEALNHALRGIPPEKVRFHTCYGINEGPRTYYAAVVKSMLSSWHNFFFVSFDPGGFVSVDKPPLGLWIQAASAWLFGFRGLSLLVRQALAGVLSVGLLFFLVRRAFGPLAGLVAGARAGPDADLTHHQRARQPAGLVPVAGGLGLHAGGRNRVSSPSGARCLRHRPGFQRQDAGGVS